VTPHRLVSPGGMAPAVGFSHAVVPAAGRPVYVDGQVAADPSGTVVGDTLAEQFGIALGNVVAALAACGATPEHVVSMTVYTTAMADYRASRREIGTAYRERFGRHFPAMALLGVSELVEPRALVEIVATAVVP
jgi:enamine deaminase RidA (YjgF/YER057c/UK114 family)